MLMDKEINILFVSHDSGLAGAESSLLDLLTGLNKKRFKPTVIIPQNGQLVNELEKICIPYHIEYFSRWIPYRYESGAYHLKDFIFGLNKRVNNIRNLIINNNIDIVYTNTITCIDGAIAAYRSKIPHIWHIREYLKNNDDLKTYVPNFINMYLLNSLSKYIITNSCALKVELNRYIPINKILVVYNGVEINKFNIIHQSENILKTELGIPEEKKIVAMVGNINPNKDYETFIKSAKIIKNNYDNVIFIVIGGGIDNYVEKLKNNIKIIGLNDCFYFLGFRYDIPYILNNIDILVLTSKREAFGRVIIEGMAAAKPVVATRSGGPEEIIVNGETGILVSVGDHISIAKEIIELLKNKNLSDRMGIIGQKRVAEVFNMNMYVEKIQELIVKVVNRSHG